MIKILNSNTPAIHNSSTHDLYPYKVYVGKHTISTNNTSSYWYIKDNLAVCYTGLTEIVSEHMCVEILGYTPETRSSTFSRGTDLPYINGCSSKQLIPAVRPGDPTFQMLFIPPQTSEQAHHIHATARVVYVAEGSGKSIVGNGSKHDIYPLNKGQVIILDKMLPHHFMTDEESLTVLPIHIFSSIASEEFNHPMFNGTHKV